MEEMFLVLSAVAVLRILSTCFLVVGLAHDCGRIL
jgi:hypothetical protein